MTDSVMMLIYLFSSSTNTFYSDLLRTMSSCLFRYLKQDCWTKLPKKYQLNMGKYVCLLLIQNSLWSFGYNELPCNAHSHPNNAKQTLSISIIFSNLRNVKMTIAITFKHAPNHRAAIRKASHWRTMDTRQTVLAFPRPASILTHRSRESGEQHIMRDNVILLFYSHYLPIVAYP